MKAPVGHSGGGGDNGDQKKKVVGTKSCIFGNAREPRMWSGRRRTAMGRGMWSEMKASVGHGNSNGSGLKKKAAVRGRVALQEH